MVSKGWQNCHPWKMIPQLPSSSFNHLKGKASERVSHDPSDNHFQSLEISKKTAPNGRLCDRKAGLLLISLSPLHFHLSTDSICHEEAGHQSSRSGRLCFGSLQGDKKDMQVHDISISEQNCNDKDLNTCGLHYPSATGLRSREGEKPRPAKRVGRLWFSSTAPRLLLELDSSRIKRTTPHTRKQVRAPCQVKFKQ